MLLQGVDDHITASNELCNSFRRIKQALPFTEIGRCALGRGRGETEERGGGQVNEGTEDESPFSTVWGTVELEEAGQGLGYIEGHHLSCVQNKHCPVS